MARTSCRGSKFLVLVREANGGVSWTLLEAYGQTLSADVKKDLWEKSLGAREEFFKLWRRQYNVVYRHFAGQRQYLLADYEKRKADFFSMLASLTTQRKIRVFLCGDETGLRIFSRNPSSRRWKSTS